MANTKKKPNRSNTNQSRSNPKRKNTAEEDRNDEVRLEVILLVILAFSVFLIIANFGKCGVVGNAISGFLFGLFGVAAYVLPVYLFLSSAFLISNHFHKKVRNKVIYTGVVLILVSMLSQLLHEKNFQSVKQLYLDGYHDHDGGGLVSGGIFFLFRSAIGIPGVCIVMAIAALIMFILITNISVVDTFKKWKDSLFEREEAYEDDPDNKSAGQTRNLESEPVRKNKTNLKNLKVYDSKQKERPKDFFAIDDEVHELKLDGEDFAGFDNGVEKIVMQEEDHYSPRKTERQRKTVQLKPVERKSRNQEDVLAGAVNGNLYPERLSGDQEDAYGDASFTAIGNINREKTGIEEEVKRVESQIQKANGEKSYKAGARYKYPTPNLLAPLPKGNTSNRDAYVRTTAIKLKNTLENFGVNVTITNYSCGPAVTRFEMQPEQGVKVSKILGLADDIKLNLAAADIRIEAPIPGKAAIGIEVPNKETSVVSFRELIESENFKNSKSKISFAVGKDISGQVIAADIAKMPHLLIAGATGSGKSVCINTLIMSILYKATPEEVKLIMIDPKMVELACYNGIPHLLIPVVTDPKKASGALNWAVEEMTRRYQTFADYNVRNIQGYNEKVAQAKASGDVDDEKLAAMPQIVVIVDELADLMMVAHGEVEDAIVRLSQLARAAGIHLVIATQRPSVDVITGLIKANVPSRIAFAVSSGVDSRTILDMVGAEKLLGKGDMLFYPTGYPKPVRVQGAFVSDEEVVAVVDFLKKQNGVGSYDDEISKSIVSAGAASTSGTSGGSDKDEYFIEAGRFIIEKEKASIGMLQRAFKIGFNRAARIMDQLADAGVVGPEEGTKARKIMMSQEQFDEYIEEYY